jgi:hypothetical protein
MAGRVEAHLRLPPEEQEARAEPLFRDLACFTVEALARSLPFRALPTLVLDAPSGPIAP